jgi:tRNA pseudouridine38-40 synthase
VVWGAPSSLGVAVPEGADKRHSRVRGDRTLLLGLAYDGADWAGIAVQNNARTVGGALLAALARFDPAIDKLRLASRTDAGVHARAQRVSFDTTKDVPCRGWVLGLNRHLPPSIRVRWASRVSHGFNPRFEARGKRYRYLLACEPVGDPFLARRAWHLYGLAADDVVEPLRNELNAALGRHDFSAFASASDEREHRERTLTRVAVERLGASLVAIDIEGDHFLHNMVRILVGTAVDVARGHLPPGALGEALASRDRRAGGQTAPAAGLYLEALKLTTDGEDRWPPSNVTSPC